MKLTSLKIDSNAVDNGEWIRPDPDQDLEILTRGFTDAYTDSRARRMRAAAKGFGGDTSKVPNAMQRTIITDALLQHVTLDVRGLTNDDGSAVTYAQFCDAVRDAAYPELFGYAVTAASMVGQSKADDLADAVGN